MPKSIPRSVKQICDVTLFQEDPDLLSRQTLGAGFVDVSGSFSLVSKEVYLPSARRLKRSKKAIAMESQCSNITPNLRHASMGSEIYMRMSACLYKQRNGGFSIQTHTRHSPQMFLGSSGCKKQVYVPQYM